MKSLALKGVLGFFIYLLSFNLLIAKNDTYQEFTIVGEGIVAQNINYNPEKKLTKKGKKAYKKKNFKSAKNKSIKRANRWSKNKQLKKSNPGLKNIKAFNKKYNTPGIFQSLNRKKQ